MKDKSKIKKKKINFDEPPVDDNEIVETTATEVDDKPAIEAQTTSQAESINNTTEDNYIDERSEETYIDEHDEAAKEAEKEKVKIDFPFSDLVRAKIPKFFEVAETAATQWKHNEKFENLGVPHPVGEIALSKALEKAKEVEKKLKEKGIISAAKMGIAVAKFQAQDLIKKFKKDE